MLLIRCPHCGVDAPETELSPGGEAHIRRAGPESDDTAFVGYLFERRNPKGLHLERWRHAYGCGKWFHVARSTVTLEVFGSYPATSPEPPPDILARIETRAGGR